MKENEIPESIAVKRFMASSVHNTTQLLKTFYDEEIIGHEPFRSCSAVLSTVNLAILERIKGGVLVGDEGHFADAYIKSLEILAKRIDYNDEVNSTNENIEEIIIYALDTAMNHEDGSEEKARFLFFSSCLVMLQVSKVLIDIEHDKLEERDLEKVITALDDFNDVTMDLFKEYIKQKCK